MSARLLNQPDDQQIGAILTQILADRAIVRFESLVAFAVSSGVQELQAALESVLAHGGTVRIVVGVSNRVTTVEGLRLLLGLVQKGAKVFVFHNDNAANPIYHPKLYLCLRKDGGALIVGSSNMTGKGLVGNYEVSLLEELNLANKPDSELLASAEQIIEKYCNVATGFAHVLDEKFLQELDEAGYLGSEARATNKPETSSETDVAAAPATPRKKLFASKGVPQAASGKGPAARAAQPQPAQPPVPAAAIVAARKGPLLWEKTLQISDTGQARPGSNPTGGVRLTQARFRVGGRIINQTTYFRNQVFQNQNWQRVSQRVPFRERARVRFHVEVNGRSLGDHVLEVSHKPSGEAGQGNYTDQIHWGSLSSTIRRARVAGRRLRLFGPAPGTTEPFFIEIT